MEVGVTLVIIIITITNTPEMVEENKKSHEN